MPNPQISIIVPVFNCASNKDFTRMLESLLAQSLQSFELILCDDGSEDNTVELCEEFAAQDKRVKIICCQHSGVSAARNAGLEVAMGEWITFVDSDDYLLPGFLEAMISATANEKCIDTVFSSYAIVGRSGCKFKIYPDECHIGIADLRSLFSAGGVLERCSPWGKLFRRSIIMDNGLKFNCRLSHSEDRHFIYRLLRHVKAVATSSYLGYLYADFSANSLKYKNYDFKTLCTRQQLITSEGMNLLKHYDIAAEYSYGVGRNIINLINDTCRNIYSMKQPMTNRIAMLRDFMGDFFNKEISDLVLSDMRTVRYVESSQHLRLLTCGNYKGYCRLMSRQTRLIGLKRRISNILERRHEQPDFGKFVDMFG